MIRELQELRLLVRGDFLCDVLDHLAKTDAVGLPEEPLLLEEFWSSEEYFFHDAEQMQLVASMCPNMRKVMFQFNREIAGDFINALSPFRKLTELHSWGGEFYSDRLSDLLLLLGDRLRILYLIHVDEIDTGAISLISTTCISLTTLGFYNCIFREQNPLANLEV